MGWQRPLTGIERWHWLFDRAAPMNVVFTARVRGTFDPDRVRRALAVVAGHYPTLTARIEPAGRPLLVATEQAIPLRVLPWEEGAWRAHAVDEANQRIAATTGPLARLTLLNGPTHSDLLWSFHQAMADGLSGAHLLDEILTVYGGGARPALTARETLEPPLAGHLGTRLAAWLTTLRDIPTMRRLSPLPPHVSAPPEERRTALLDAQVPASLTTALGHHAGEHGSSVHGALAAAMLLSIGEELRGRNHARRDSIGCATPVDLRRRLQLPPGLVGNFLSRVVTAHQVHYDTLFWDLAAEVSGDLRRATATGAAFAEARLQEGTATGVSDRALPRRVRNAERSQRAAAVINNLGRLEFFTGYGDVTLERLGFLVSSNAYVGSSLVLSALTLNDTTALNFTFAQPLMEPERARALVDGALSRLHHAVG